MFLQSGQITGFDGLFLDRDITELYENLFASVGTQIALWYQDNFEKYIQKNQPAVNWRETFGAFGRRFAADKVTLVSGNRKKELQAVLKRLMSDPDFQALNERQEQRILRSQFTGYSRTQAMRLVRTESITAANYAATQTANDHSIAAAMYIGSASIGRRYHAVISNVANRIRLVVGPTKYCPSASSPCANSSAPET